MTCSIDQRLLIGFIIIIPLFLLIINFRLRQVLLRTEEERMAKQSPELVSEEAAPTSRKNVRKIRM
jgi:hypothetical protein